jgi:hypothetical protein
VIDSDSAKVLRSRTNSSAIVPSATTTAQRTSFPQKPFPLTSSRIGLFKKERTVESTVKDVTDFVLRETKGIAVATPY